jgi:hypothetical protein
MFRTFRKAKRCKWDPDLCVEVSLPEAAGQPVLVRNSNVPGVLVSFTEDEWSTFLAGARAGEFDLP